MKDLNKSSDRWYIYLLYEPNSLEPRYVGKCNNLSDRYRNHLHELKRYKHRRARWLQSLLSKGLKPLMAVIEEGFGKGWQEKEKFWIRILRSIGIDLVNGTDGGDGSENVSLETRLRRSKMLKHYRANATEEQKARHTSGNLYGTEHYRAKLNPKIVREIRRIMEANKKNGRFGYGVATELGKRFGVCREAIKDIAHYKTWKSVK